MATAVGFSAQAGPAFGADAPGMQFERRKRIGFPESAQVSRPAGLSSTAQWLQKMLEPVIAEYGAQLVNATFTSEGTRRKLRVTVDHSSSLDLELIGAISEAVSRRLDLEDSLPGPYELEVSSPGPNRALEAPEHFERFKGEQVSVRLNAPVEGQTSFQGEIVSAGSESFTIAAGEKIVELFYVSVASARLAIDWEEVLRRRKPERARRSSRGGKR